MDGVRALEGVELMTWVWWALEEVSVVAAVSPAIACVGSHGRLRGPTTQYCPVEKEPVVAAGAEDGSVIDCVSDSLSGRVLSDVQHALRALPGTAFHAPSPLQVDAPAP